MLGLGLNIVVILALLAVLAYAWRLDRRLRDLDATRGETQKFFGEFNAAIARAERGIRQLHDTAQDQGEQIEAQFQRAAALRDELNFLVDAADKIATRLTNQTSQAQAEALARAPSAPRTDATPRAASPVFEAAFEAAPPAASARAAVKSAERNTESAAAVKAPSAPPVMKIAPRLPDVDAPPAAISDGKGGTLKLPAWLKPAAKGAPAAAAAASAVPSPAPEMAAAVPPAASFPEPARQDNSGGLRSDAERELQQALEKMR